MRVAVIGLGYVGLVTAVGLAAHGHRVVAVDLDAARVAAVGRGEVPFHEPGLPAMLGNVLADGRFEATTDLATAMSGAEISMIAVGTPEGQDGIDLAQIVTAAEAIGRALDRAAPDHVVVVKSTVVPGTTDTMVAAALERGAGPGRRAALAMNPEFLREGSALADFMAPDRIVVGATDDAARERVVALYAGFDAPIVRTSLRDAETIKYATNALLALLVSYSNELAALCEATPGTDVDVVLDGLHLDRRLTAIVRDQRVPAGITTYLRAGVGFGGSCLPKDVAALRAHARALGVATPLLDAAAAVNEARPAQVLGLLERELGGLAGSEVAVLGLAFKPGTDDMRCSPGLAAIARLLEAGARVRAHDPLVPARRAGLDPRVVPAASVEEALAGADAVLVATAWPEYAALDWSALVASMRRPVVLDGRNLLRGLAWPAGVRYMAIGRAPGQRPKEALR